MTEKRPVDWEAVEMDYRAGIKSVRTIAADRGCSPGRISQLAKAKGWSRDLSAKIKIEAEARLNRDALNEELNAKRRITEREVVSASAEAIAGVVRGQRKSLGELSEIYRALVEKAKAIISEAELFEQIGDICAKPDENGQDKIGDVYKKVCSLPSQTDVVKRLAETLRLLIELERKVFRIDDQPDDPPPANQQPSGGSVTIEAVTALMDKIAEARGKS